MDVFCLKFLILNIQNILSILLATIYDFTVHLKSPTLIAFSSHSSLQCGTVTLACWL